jgi:GDP-L-fucose synthase
MDKDSRIFIAGHEGMVGSALENLLGKEGYQNLITRSKSELDLRDQNVTKEFFLKEKPNYVFLAAAKVGGIYANNTYPAEFIYDNLQIQNNVIHYSWKTGVKKLLFLSSNCAYPKNCPQPMKEEYLLTGPLEPTNEPFAVAKIAGIRMCEAYNKQYGINFTSVIPASLFGPHDSFDLENAHLVPTLIRKFHEAKVQNADKVTLWGTGKPRRELMCVEDAARACLFLMQNYNSSSAINAGLGKDLCVRDIAGLVKGVVGFGGEVAFDMGKPDGMMQKLLDSSKINSLGWQAKTNLKEDLEKTYEWFKKFTKD